MPEFLARWVLRRMLPTPRVDALRPPDVGLEGEELRIPTSDGLSLHGWWVPAASARGTLLSLHGAGHTVGEDLQRLRFLHREGWSVMTFDYRGFGESEGVIDADRMPADCFTALEEVRRRRGEGPLVVKGRSLGAGLALLLGARDRDIDGLVLVAPPPSLQEMAAVHPWIVERVGEIWARRAVRWLLGPPRGPIRFAAEVAPTPILLVQGEEDAMVPMALALRVYEAARDPKELHLVPGVGHDPLGESAEARQRVIRWLEGL